jgi:hypothetical protein
VPVFPMLVYGEQHYQERLSVFVRHLLERNRNTPADDLDELRTLLIQTGQLEQGVEDYESSRPARDRVLSRQVRRLTDLAATEFLSRLAGRFKPGISARAAGAALQEYWEALEGIRFIEDPWLRIRIPEGFEYYTLFPEQYCATAFGWLQHHQAAVDRRAIVLGIRSIGTTLSAMVSAVLKAAGWHVERTTVRPAGHPFNRAVSSGEVRKCAHRCGLVVDEGPGLSGSSMAAGARALAEAGCSDISLLPGHRGDPGTAASPEVRRCWVNLPRYCAQLEDLRWDGCSLQECLRKRTERLRPNLVGKDSEGNADWSEREVRVENVSGGQWRRWAYRSQREWPPVAERFERTKYLCRVDSQPIVLWKFSGLGCCWHGGKTSTELELQDLSSREAENLVAKPIKIFRGFLAVPWSHGERLDRHSSKARKALSTVARYLIVSAGAPLDGRQLSAARTRLTEMIRCNLAEKFGEALAARAAHWAAGAKITNVIPAYTDGHLAPYEWVASAYGVFCKTDCFGHVFDHTLVGQQPLLWDVAGTLVEWDVRPSDRAQLLTQLSTAGILVEPITLALYELAYATFRMGLFSLCASQATAQDSERARLLAAEAFYTSKTADLLKATPLPNKKSSLRAELAHPNR